MAARIKKLLRQAQKDLLSVVLIGTLMGCIDMQSSGLEEKSASDGAEGRTPEIYHVRASSAIQIAASEFDKFQRLDQGDLRSPGRK